MNRISLFYDMKNLEVLSSAKMQSFVTIIVTVFALYKESTSVFYLLYLFWFIEFLRTIINIIYRKWMTSKSDIKYKPSKIFDNFFFLVLYFIFILILFGFVLQNENTKIIQLNFQVIAFQNWYFNFNLLFFVASYIFELYRNHTSVEEIDAESGMLNLSFITLHLSIILCAIIWGFLIRPYPDYFTPENTLGMILIASPFLILQLLLNVAKEKN